MKVLEMLTLAGIGAPAKGGYVWQIESVIGIHYW